MDATLTLATALAEARLKETVHQQQLELRAVSNDWRTWHSPTNTEEAFDQPGKAHHQTATAAAPAMVAGTAAKDYTGSVDVRVMRETFCQIKQPSVLEGQGQQLKCQTHRSVYCSGAKVTVVPPDLPGLA